MKKHLPIVALLLMLTVPLLTPPPAIEAEAAIYPLAYELYGGTNHPLNPTSYNTNNPDYTFNAPTNGNQEFLGFYASPMFLEHEKIDNFPSPWVGISKIYARWGAPVFEVNFQTNGGSAVSSRDIRATYAADNNNPTYIDTAHGYGNTTIAESLSGDFNNDGYGDFMHFNSASNKFVRYISTGFDGGFSPIVTTPLGSGLTVKNSAYLDIDSDLIDDILIMYAKVSMGTNITVSWMRGLGNGNFAAEAWVTFDASGITLLNSEGFDFGDINKDYKVDIVFSTNGIAAYALGNGDGTFGALTAINTNALQFYGTAINVDDMDFDGDLDIVYHASDRIYFLKHNGSTAAPFYPTEALYLSGGSGDDGYATDLNQDGRKEYYFKQNGGFAAFQRIEFNADFTVGTTNYIHVLGYFYNGIYDFDTFDVNNDGILDSIYMSVTGYTRIFLSNRTNQTYTAVEKIIGNYDSGVFIVNRKNGTTGFAGYEVTSQEVRAYGVSAKHYLSSGGTSAYTGRDYYNFEGWYYDSAFTLPVNFNWDILTGDVTLYAKWSPVTFGVGYTLNGGTNHPSNPTTRTIESAAFTLQTPSKPGSLFLGWYTTSNFQGDPITVLPAGTNANINLYAKWLDPNTISFNSNGGTAVPSITTLPGNPVSAPANPTRAGYTFDGWYSDRNFTQPYTFTTMPEASISVFAKWIALTFTVTFNTNGGSPIAPISRDTDQSLNLPAAPTKTGHTFDGWYLDQALTNRLTATKMTPNDLTLYAKWLTNIRTLIYTVDDATVTQAVPYGTTLASLLPTPTKYQHEFLGWSLDGITVTTLPSTMPDNNLTLIALFRDNVDPVVFTLTDGDTYAGGVDIIFNEGTALLNGQPVQSGYRVQQAGTYTLVLTDGGGNVVEVTFTVIAAVDNSTTRWIIFAVILAATWLFLTVLYFLNRKPSVGGSGGGTLVMNTPAPKPKPVVKTKKKVAPTKPVEKPATVKTVAPAMPTPPAQPVAPQPKVQNLPKPETTKPVEVNKPVPKVEVKKPAEKVPPMPEVKPEVIDQQLTDTIIFSKPLKIKVDPAENFKPEVKTEFDNVFVSDKRAVKVPELTYVPQTTNVPFYTNLFRYIHRFAGVLTEGLLGTLTQSVIKLTDDKEAQLKIVEASTRTAEGLKTNHNQDYLLKILRRNVALNRDVLNPRNKYVYSYQRLATLLEEMGIYLEAVILVREAYERGLVDTPDATFEKRLTRLEKKLVDSGGQRQDMIRK